MSAFAVKNILNCSGPSNEGWGNPRCNFEAFFYFINTVPKETKLFTADNMPFHFSSSASSIATSVLYHLLIFRRISIKKPDSRLKMLPSKIFRK